MFQQKFAQICELFTAGRPSRRRRSLALTQPEVLEQRQLLAATAVQAFHRSGQTFVTWTEDASVSGEGYHVYRSSSPITTANIASAEKLTSKWGALDDNTSVHTRVAPGVGVPANFVINDLSSPLRDNQGLFVYTTPDGESGTWYYAVTEVIGGVESKVITAGSNSLSNAISESVATPQPVLTVSNASGKGRIYTQYMDYANWNPTFQGYAYNYSVALPNNYNPNVAWPVKLMPHAYGERFRMEQSAEFGWPCIEVFLDDSGGGGPGRNRQTWWYGFAADHNYITDGAIPSSGHVENFTEQRVLKAIDEVSSMFSVDSQRIHSQGHSMGASGSVSLGMRYADVFSGIFASEPMTNYAASPGFQSDFSMLWGTQASNLPIVNRGSHAGPLRKYDGMGVYQWMNHQEQLVNRRGEPMAFLMVGHGKADDIIDWATQGRPFIAALNAGNVGFTAEQRYGWDHNWMSFNFALDSMFSPAEGGLGDWAYPRNLSFPGISLATGSGPNQPGTTGTNFYNMNIEWSVPWNNFHQNIIDTSTRYEISLKSTAGVQTVDLTPQRVQAFRPTAGTLVSWKNINNATGAVVQSGTLAVDADGLVTLPRVTIGTGSGNRMILTSPSSGISRPVLTAPSTTANPRPQIAWNGTDDTSSYEVLVRNVSTGLNQVLRTTVTGLNYTPTSDLPLGRYRVYVRSNLTSGQVSAWSLSRDFRITTAPVIAGLPSVTYTGAPYITWGNLAGAVSYELLINNLSTGAKRVVAQSNISDNFFQVSTNLGLGAYQVYVRGIDAAGLAGQWSVGGRINSKAAVVLTSPENSTFETQPEFLWESLPGAIRYEFVLLDHSTNAVLLRKTDLTSASFIPDSPLSNGDYRWWVRGFSATGIVGSWSRYNDVNIGGTPSLLNVPATTNDRTPSFFWTAVQGAARYEIWIATLDNVMVLNVRTLTTNTFTPTTNLAPQSYRVWVRAVSTTGIYSAWSSSATFTVTKLESDPPSLPESLNESLVGHLFEEPLPPQIPMDPSELAIVMTQEMPSSEREADVSEYAAESDTDIDRLMMEWAVGVDTQRGLL